MQSSNILELAQRAVSLKPSECNTLLFYSIQMWIFFWGGISILCSPSVPSVSLANVKLQQSVATGSVSWQLPQVGKLRKEWESWVESSRSSWRTRATRFTRHIPSLTVCVIMGQAVFKKANKTKQNKSIPMCPLTNPDPHRTQQEEISSEIKDCSWPWSLWHDDVMMLWQLSHYHLAATQTSAALQSTTWKYLRCIWTLPAAADFTSTTDFITQHIEIYFRFWVYVSHFFYMNKPSNC